MPSIWYETFGRTIIEADAKGTPVVASRLGAMAELVDEGRTGLLFEPGNAAHMAAKVGCLLDDPARLAGMRVAARGQFGASSRRRQIIRCSWMSTGMLQTNGCRQNNTENNP